MAQSNTDTGTSFGTSLKRFSAKYFSLLQLSGWLILFIIWWLVTNFSLINNHIMPTPQKTGMLSRK